MKVLTLWQPWASCIALGLKRFETRSWPTPYTGELFIHAAVRIPRVDELAVFRLNPSWKRVFQLLGVADFLDLPRGAVLCKCNLVRCIPTVEYRNPDTREGRLERVLGGWEEGRFAWQLENVQAFMPIPMKGAQGLWEPAREDKNKLLLAGR